MNFPRYRLRLAGLLLNLIFVTLLLAACSDNKTSLPTAAPAPTAVPAVNPGNPSSGALATPAPGVSGGKIGPTVGPDGQITVPAVQINPAGLTGNFFWAKNYNIWQGGQGTPAITAEQLGGKALTKATGLATASYPALSPDGNTLAYSYSPEPDASTPGKIVIGQDIMALDLKTQQSKVLVKRAEPDGFVDHPAWSADGRYLYYSYRSTERSKEGIVVGQRLSIGRLELATNQREELTQDAREPSPTPDGKSVVYVGVAASTQTYEYSLQILDLATKKSRPLTTPDQSFSGYYQPKVAPDGQTLVFAGVGGPDAAPLPNAQPFQPSTPPVKSQRDSSGGGITAFGLNPTADSAFALALHGLPYDLWIIKPDGTGLRRLTTLFEDQPMAVWSKDGKQIYFLAGQGFYVINADGTGLSKKSNEGGHGGFDYRP